MQNWYLVYTSPERDRYWESALNPTIYKVAILEILRTDTRPLLEIRPTQNPTVLGPVPSEFYTDTLSVRGIYTSPIVRYTPCMRVIMV
jgi:hypothetical protein